MSMPYLCPLSLLLSILSLLLLFYIILYMSCFYALVEL